MSSYLYNCVLFHTLITFTKIKQEKRKIYDIFHHILANTSCIFTYFIKIFINKLFEIDFETNVSDKSFIEEQRFEAIIASLSSSNNKYR